MADKTMSELIAEAYERERTQRLIENRERMQRPPPEEGRRMGAWSPEQREMVKNRFDQEIENWDNTEGMNWGEKIGAGFWSGAKRIYEGGKNVAGFMSDEDWLESRRLDRDLGDTLEGSYGQFLGETWSLMPTAGIGNLARKVNIAAKGVNEGQRVAKFLPKTLERATTPGMSAVYDSAAAGALASDPNERGRGAILGGASGGLLNKVIEGTGRIFRRGLAESSPSAKSLQATTKKELGGGELGSEVFIPLTQAAKGDSITAATKSSMDAVSMMPKARNAMEEQSLEALDDMYKIAIHRAFNKGPKRDLALKVFRETGDMQLTLDTVANRFPGKQGLNTEVLENAGKSRKRGLPEPTDIIKASEKQAVDRGLPKSSGEMRKLANEFSDVLEDQSVGTSNVESRMLYHKASKSAEGFMGGVGATVDKIPLIGPALGSKSIQNFLMGNTKWQQRLRKVLSGKGGETVDEFVDAARRAAAAQPVSNDESSDFLTVQDMADAAARKAKETVTGK